MARTLPILDTVINCYKLVCFEFPYAIKISWHWLTLLAVTTMLAALTADLAWQQGGLPSAELGLAAVLMICGALFYLVSWTSIAVLWHRHFLLDEDRIGIPVQVNVRMLRYLLRFLLISLILIIAAIPALLFLRAVARAEGTAGSFVFVSNIIGLIFGLLFLRLGIALPATAIDKNNFGIVQGWRKTSGNGFKLIMILMLIWMPFYGLDMLLALATDQRIVPAALTDHPLTALLDALYYLFVGLVGVTLLTLCYAYLVEEREFSSLLDRTPRNKPEAGGDETGRRQAGQPSSGAKNDEAFPHRSLYKPTLLSPGMLRRPGATRPAPRPSPPTMPTTSELLALMEESAESWNDWRKNNPGSEINLAGADLQRRNLDGYNLHDADLAWANLEGASLEKAYLRDANLQSINLKRGNLRKSVLRKVRLEDADLQGADLTGADLEDANLDRVNLAGARLKLANFHPIDCQSRSSWSCDFEGVSIRDANLAGADLRNTDLRKAYLVGANLESAILRGATLEQANLKVANLKGADLEHVRLEGANLSGAKSLFQDQINLACGDQDTVLENGLTIPMCADIDWWQTPSDRHERLTFGPEFEAQEWFRPMVRACPSFRDQWMSFVIEYADDAPNLPMYIVLGDLAYHLLDRIKAGDVEGFDAVFDVIEQWHHHHDHYVREATTVGLLEDMQKILSNRGSKADFGSVERWLRPQSIRRWYKLIRFWDGDLKALRE